MKLERFTASTPEDEEAPAPAKPRRLLPRNAPPKPLLVFRATTITLLRLQRAESHWDSPIVRLGAHRSTPAYHDTRATSHLTSIAGLFSEPPKLPPTPSMRLTSQDHADPSSPQLYLACFLHIIPSTKTIQDEVIPVVCSPFPHSPTGYISILTNPHSSPSGPSSPSAPTSSSSWAGVSSHSMMYQRPTTS